MSKIIFEISETLEIIIAEILALLIIITLVNVFYKISQSIEKPIRRRRFEDD